MNLRKRSPWKWLLDITIGLTLGAVGFLVIYAVPLLGGNFRNKWVSTENLYAHAASCLEKERFQHGSYPVTLSEAQPCITRFRDNILDSWGEPIKYKRSGPFAYQMWGCGQNSKCFKQAAETHDDLRFIENGLLWEQGRRIHPDTTGFADSSLKVEPETLKSDNPGQFKVFVSSQEYGVAGAFV